MSLLIEVQKDGRERGRLYLTLYCYHQTESALEWAAVKPSCDLI